MSCGLTHREKSAPDIAFRLASVSIMLGRIQLTLMFFDLTYSASDSTSFITPLFEATYAASFPAPLSAGLADV